MMTQAEYAARKGMNCPECGSEEFEGFSIEIAAGTASQELHCHHCPAMWYDLYTLTGFELVEENDMKK